MEELVYSQQRLDIQIIRSQDDLEKHLLIDLNELGVPLSDLAGPPPGFLGHVSRRVRGDGKRVGFVVVAVFEDLCWVKGGLGRVGEGEMRGKDVRRAERAGRREEGWTDLFEDVAGNVGERDGGVDITDIYMPCSRGLPRSQNRERMGSG